MNDVLDRVLEAGSQEEARRHPDDLREQLGEKASSALEILGDGFCDATAVLTLPEKYRKRLLGQHAGTLHSGDPAPREGDPDLPEHGLIPPVASRSIQREGPRRGEFGRR